jgi:hypothetical protein
LPTRATNLSIIAVAYNALSGNVVRSCACLHDDMQKTSMQCKQGLRDDLNFAMIRFKDSFLFFLRVFCPDDLVHLGFER